MYGRRWRWGWERKGPGRPPKPRTIGFSFSKLTFIPYDDAGNIIQNNPVYLTPDEVEAMRLVYIENLTQEEAARRMNVSRGTLWRSLSSGRKKLAQAIIERRPIVITA